MDVGSLNAGRERVEFVHGWMNEKKSCPELMLRDDPTRLESLLTSA